MSDDISLSKRHAMGISSKMWRYVTSASAADFKELVAEQEWKMLDWYAAKIRVYLDGTDGAPEGLQDFLDLYDMTADYLAEHKQLPPAILKLVRGVVDDDQ